MTLFSHVMQGHGHGQGAQAVSVLGVDFLARKSGSGQPPRHMPETKASTARCLAEGFGMRNPSNVDLILRRKPSPEPGASVGYAGANPSSCGGNRVRDLPEVIRRTSITHGVHKRHCSQSPERNTGPRNMVMELASCNRDVRDCGRGVASKASSRSQKHRSLSPTARSPRTNTATGYHSATVRPARKISDDVANLLQSSSSTASIELSFPSASREPIFCKAYTSSGSEDDDDASTMVPRSGSPSSCRSPALSNLTDYFLESNSEASMEGPALPHHDESLVMTFAKSLNKRSAEMYERSLKERVKAAQKRALKRVA